MKKRMLICSFCMVVIFSASTLWAASKDVPFDWKNCAGVSLAGANAANDFNQGKVVSGKVVDPGILTKQGIKGAKKGDAVKITPLDGKKFKLMHIPSGNEVTMNFNDTIVDYSRPKR